MFMGVIWVTNEDIIWGLNKPIRVVLNKYMIFVTDGVPYITNFASTLPFAIPNVVVLMQWLSNVNTSCGDAANVAVTCAYITV